MFRRSGQSVFRLDTRVYLADVPTARKDGRCIAAVIGKNPGSARSNRLGVWEPVELHDDKMLPYVRIDSLRHIDSGASGFRDMHLYGSGTFFTFAIKT